MIHIPSVNLKDFISESSTKKEQFINDIGKAYEEIGFVALKGHFLDEKLIENAIKHGLLHKKGLKKNKYFLSQKGSAKMYRN